MPYYTGKQTVKRLSLIIVMKIMWIKSSHLAIRGDKFLIVSGSNSLQVIICTFTKRMAMLEQRLADVTHGLYVDP